MVFLMRDLRLLVRSLVVPGWCQKVYKYMRIYLWTALRIKVFVQGRQAQDDKSFDGSTALTAGSAQDKVIFWSSFAKAMAAPVRKSYF